ncbi:MAG: acyl-CoA dehydrogenase family protein, partial [Planctomycetota bacterium]
QENVTSGGPDFAYDFCVRRITDEQCSGLDLSSWRVAYSGSEPVRAETMERFARKFGRWGFQAEAFLPCFGLAEASLLVTGGPGPGRGVEACVDADALARGTVTACKDGKRVVGCGLAGEGAVVRIIDPETHEPCPPERVGEIWTSGPNVADGYWRREETSIHTLQARLRGDDAAYLRTGDLGFLRDGELFVVGRMSDKIIVRGRNLHFHDIEQTVQESHSALEPHAGAAFAVERDGREALVVVQEVKREDRRRVDADKVPGVVRQVVSRSHGINVADFVLVRPGAVLKTTSGKIRRQEMRQRYLSGTLEPIESSRSASKRPRRKPADTVEPLMGWLRDYADRRLNSRLMDERKCVPPYVVLDFGNRGLLGLQGPREQRGLGLGHRDTMRIFEQLGAIDQTLALLVGIQNVLGAGPILRSATPSTRDELLPRLLAGRELAAFALTEPGAGSNPRAIRARAVPAGRGRWRLYGTKSWSGLAAWAGVINVFAHLEGPDGEGLGSVGFAVRQGSAGLRQGVEAPTMGVRAIVQNTIHLEGVEVGEADMLGKPGEGLAVAQQAMMYGRLAIAASCLGGMRRCAQLMHRYASRRSVAGGPLANNPVTLERLGETTAAIAALDALVVQIADTLDRDLPVPDDIYAAIKILGPELLWAAADRLVQMLGGRGYVETNAAPQLLRDARILRVFEGPTEAMCAHLGARLVNDESGVIGFLETRLNAPEAARTLRESLSGAHDALHHGDTQTRVMLRYRLGDLAAWAVLAGALESGAAGRESPAYRWARSALDRSVRAFPTPPPDVTFEEMTADIDSYAGRIGDVEQSMAGEDTSIDPLLQRAEPASIAERGETDPVEIPDVVPSPPASSSQRSGRTVGEIEVWLRDWVAANLDMAPEDIDTLQPFAELGADSVTAVELVVDLGEFVGQKLDDTLPWEAPNIAAVAERLGSPETPVAAAPPQAPGDAKWSDVEASLRELEKRVGRE